MKIIAIVLAVVGLFAISAAIISLLPQATAQPLPAVGNIQREFRGTQSTTAASYPSTGVLSPKGYRVCIWNDDAAADGVYMRLDGTAADSTEANCNTVGCKTILVNPADAMPVCIDTVFEKVSLDGTGDGVPFRMTILQRGGL